jgi:2-polyprenyl-3-methyl-5-hydroxy-6-metoxy-1,4-benzoquinol methylase
MKQNVYDNPVFFERYMNYRRNPACLNDAVEQPVLWACMPELKATRIIDVGCGTGSFCGAMLKHGADSVVGLDISRRMCERATQTVVSDRVRFINKAIEDFEYNGPPFDLVVSSLTLHYVADLGAIFAKIASWLKPGAVFVFSVNHPIYTSDLHHVPDFGSGIKWEMRVQRYKQEGPRPHYWFVDGVIKYHRTLETYLTALTAVGFSLGKLIELAAPSSNCSSQLGTANETPVFVVISSTKTG